MAWVAVAVGGASLIGGVVNAATAPKGAAYTPLNISQVISDAQSQATSDLQNSISLENQYLPGTSALRASSNTLNSNVAAGNTQAQQVQSGLLGQAGSAITQGASAGTNSLLQNAYTSAQQQLAQGGQLDPSTQAAVMQSALQSGGTAGISGSGAGRGLSARDLGLTSLQIQQSRTQQATSVGSTVAGLNLQGNQLALADYQTRAGLANGAVNSQNQYASALGNLMNNTQYPTSGLSPSAVAGLYVSQNNAQNQYTANQNAVAAQQNSALTSALFGAGGTALGVAGGAGLGSSLASLFGSGAGAGGVASNFGYSTAGTAGTPGLAGSTIGNNFGTSP
jgi:hypothetical protein